MISESALTCLLFLGRSEVFGAKGILGQPPG